MIPSLHRYYRLFPPPPLLPTSGYAQNAPLTDLAHAIHTLSWLSRKKVGIILLIHKNFFPLPYGRKLSISVSRISAP